MTMTPPCPISLPIAEPQTGLTVLRGLAKTRSLLTAMEIMREEVGPAFQITLPGFRPAMLVGADSNRQIMVSHSDHFRWRNPSDPVTKLLRHGVLVEDGAEHARLRAAMEPAMLKRHALGHVPKMVTYVDRVSAEWGNNNTQDMLIEMRRAALLIFMGTLLNVEFGPDMERLWRPILKAIKYISPGLWIIWPEMPRPGFKKELAQMDAYLYQIIRDRRAAVAKGKHLAYEHPDLLTELVLTEGMSDDLIRDQILTMLIAGHDTSTALLAWALHLMAVHPEMMRKATAEVDSVVGRDDISAEHLPKLTYLDTFIKETLRMYPPIHVGNRMAAQDTQIAGYELKAGTRVMASIYLSQRDERYWDKPQKFCPARFAKGSKKPPAFSYVPFGAGKRTCIGAAFAQVEAKVVLARILQQFSLVDTGRKVHVHMGATLEPRPGVFLNVRRR